MLQQQRFANTTTQIPDDIARLAHEQQLGTPQASYMIVGLARGWRWSLFLLPLYLITLASSFAMLLIAFHFFPDDSFSLPILMAWMAMFYFATIAYVITIACIQKFYVTYPCDKGLILKQSTNKFRVIRWDEKEQVVPLQLPAVIAAFQEKQTITFGDIQVNAQGITVGKRLLPPSQIKSVSLQGHQLVIYDIKQLKPWCKLSAHSIPNLFLLFALVDYARGTGSQGNEFL